MPDLLYLDTARLGLMSPGARRAQRDLIDLAGTEGGSLYFERFLRFGSDNPLAPERLRFPGLASWKGIGHLKQSLRSLAQSSPDLPVLLANRSAQLMKFAARLLFHPCQNVLVTDLGWPGYHEILANECRRANRSMTTVSIRDAILQDRLSENDLVARLRNEFSRHGCDGLFLPAVSNLGVRLPVQRIVAALQATHQLWFVVVDGAQAFCHLTPDLCHEYCDLYLAGAHKWMGANHPMGLGFYGRKQTQGIIETLLVDMTKSGDLDDPLLRLAINANSTEFEMLNETVNLAPLFACQGAADDAATANVLTRLENVATAVRVAEEHGWRPVLPEPAFRSGILLLQAERDCTRELPGATLRAAFHAKNVALSAYENGLVRLSMPPNHLQSSELEVLGRALQTIA